MCSGGANDHVTILFRMFSHLVSVDFFWNDRSSSCQLFLDGRLSHHQVTPFSSLPSARGPFDNCCFGFHHHILCCGQLSSPSHCNKLCTTIHLGHFGYDVPAVRKLCVIITAAEANEGNVNSLFFLGCYLLFFILDRTINLKQTINIEIIILVECGSHGRHMRDEETMDGRWRN